MRGAVIFVILLGSLPLSTAQTIGMEFLKVPEGSIGRIDTRVEFTIENWGLDRVFVTLPEGWKVSDTALLDGTHRFGGTSFPVRLNATSYWRLWGFPYESDTPMGRGEIYTSRNPQGVIFGEINGRQGWYLKPNEAIKVVFDVKGISLQGGIIDPLKLEKLNPDIRVVKWRQTFIMNVSEPGFITAPWAVLGANITEVVPAPYSDVRGTGSPRYYVDFELPDKAPRWDAWLEIRNPLQSMLIPKLLGATKLRLPEAKRVDMVRPVFKVRNRELIYYGYEWERDRVITGWVPWRNDFSDAPRWDGWF